MGGTARASSKSTACVGTATLRMCDGQTTSTARRLVADGFVSRHISERRRVMPYLQGTFGTRMHDEYVMVLRKRAQPK